MKQKNTSNKVLSNIKLSISDTVKEIAKARASIYFQGNISAYIAYLILKDAERNEMEKSINNSGILNTASDSKIKVKNTKIKTKK